MEREYIIHVVQLGLLTYRSCWNGEPSSLIVPSVHNQLQIITSTIMYAKPGVTQGNVQADWVQKNLVTKPKNVNWIKLEPIPTKVQGSLCIGAIMHAQNRSHINLFTRGGDYVRVQSNLMISSCQDHLVCDADMWLAYSYSWLWST